MFNQISLQYNVMDETNISGPTVFRQRFRQSEMECEVAMLMSDAREIVFVKDLLPGPSTIPEADPSSRPFVFENVGEMGPERSLASPAPDVYRFALGRLDMEVPKTAGCNNFFARLEVEDITGSDAGTAALARRRCGNSHIKAQSMLGLCVAGH